MGERARRPLSRHGRHSEPMGGLDTNAIGWMPATMSIYQGASTPGSFVRLMAVVYAACPPDMRVESLPGQVLGLTPADMHISSLESAHGLGHPEDRLLP